MNICEIYVIITAILDNKTSKFYFSVFISLQMVNEK
jgi:hypothetical protein